MKKLIHSIFGYNTSPDDAKKILSEGSFFPSEMSVELFKKKKDPKPRINYSVKTLEKCAEENSCGKKFWVLMCRMGLSPIATRKLFPQQFSPASLWDIDLAVLTKVCKPEYRLINLKLCDVGKPEVFSDWPGSRKKQFLARAHICTVTEALIVVSHYQGKHFLTTGFHAGDSYEAEVPGEKHKEKRIILMGDYRNEGMLFYSVPCELPQKFGIKNVGIVACRIPGT